MGREQKSHHTVSHCFENSGKKVQTSEQQPSAIAYNYEEIQTKQNVINFP